MKCETARLKETKTVWANLFGGRKLRHLCAHAISLQSQLVDFQLAVAQRFLQTVHALGRLIHVLQGLLQLCAGEGGLPECRKGKQKG